MNNSTQIGICTLSISGCQRKIFKPQLSSKMNILHIMFKSQLQETICSFIPKSETHLKIEHASEDETSFTVKVCKEKTHVIVIISKSLISFFTHFGVGT